MAVITGIIHPVVPQADRLHPQVHQQGHQQASQRDLLHQHPRVHPLLNHPMPRGVHLHLLNPQQQRNLPQMHPGQATVPVPVPGVHPGPGAEEAEGDNNPAEQNRFIQMIFLLNLSRKLFNYIIIS